MLCALLIPHCAAAQVLNCNLDGYKPVEGLTATVHEGVLEVKWRGERAQQLRAEFAIQNDQPIVRELASGSVPPIGYWAGISRRSSR